MTSNKSEVVEIIGGGGVQNLTEDQVPSNDPIPDFIPDSDDDEEVISFRPPAPRQIRRPPELLQPVVSEPDLDARQSSDSRRSARTIRPPMWWILPDQRPSSAALISSTDTGNTSESLFALLTNTGGFNNEPVSFSDAMKRSDAKQWEKAAQEEYESILKNGTWVLVPLPKDRKAIGCKWVFKLKHKANGEIERYKARLVAKGYSQTEGVDFNETFAPVAKFASIRSLLALAAFYDLEVHQMDVKTAFLNGDLEEEIYMQQPEGFVVNGKEDLVCKLNKSLYGLKQASRAWYQKMDQALLNIHFRRLQTDSCVYVLRDGDLMMFVALYVDDLLLLSNSSMKLATLKQDLAKKFEMKDLGEAHFILGIQIERNRSARTLCLSQTSYVKKVLDGFGTGHVTGHVTWSCDHNRLMRIRLFNDVQQHIIIPV